MNARHFAFAVLLSSATSAGAMFDTLADGMEEIQETERGGTLFDGNELLNWAQKDRVFFIGYVAGVSDGLRLRRRYCLPERSTVVQIGDVVEKHLRENPKVRHRLGSYLVSEALIKAWPCATQPTPSRP